MPRLTKSEREKIIIDFVKGKPTPGYEVVELSNGKYQVKEVKIIVEVEEEDQEEHSSLTSLVSRERHSNFLKHK